MLEGLDGLLNEYTSKVKKRQNVRLRVLPAMEPEPAPEDADELIAMIRLHAVEAGSTWLFGGADGRRYRVGLDGIQIAEAGKKHMSAGDAHAFAAELMEAATVYRMLARR